MNTLREQAAAAPCGVVVQPFRAAYHPLIVSLLVKSRGIRALALPSLFFFLCLSSSYTPSASQDSIQNRRAAVVLQPERPRYSQQRMTSWANVDGRDRGKFLRSPCIEVNKFAFNQHTTVSRCVGRAISNLNLCSGQGWGRPWPQTRICTPPLLHDCNLQGCRSTCLWACLHQGLFPGGRVHAAQSRALSAPTFLKPSARQPRRLASFSIQVSSSKQR